MKKKLLWLFALIPAGLLAAAGYEAFIFRHGAGSVDWQAGVIHARGEWPLKGGDKAAAERGATLKAQANALLLVQQINVDGDTRLQDDQVLVRRAQGIIRGGRVSSQVVHGVMVVDLEVPVSGVNSLLSVIVTDFKSKYLPPPPPPPPAPKVTPPASSPSAPKSAPGSAPGSTPGTISHDTLESIVIDARGSGLQPALMPKVKDNAGTPVYTAASVASDDLLSGGQVKYVTAGRGVAQRFFGGRGFTILLTGNPASPTVIPGALRVTRADGRQHGDLVLAAGEEAKLQTPEAQAKLKQGKVLVIMDPTVGGVDGWWYQPAPYNAAGR